MKILAPLSNAGEVKLLCKAGADQFYCGLVHEDEALNDRPNTAKFNISNVEELSQAVKIAHRFERDIFLVINNLTPSLNKAINQAKIAEQVGMKGVIISNPLLMKKISKMKLKLDLCASCLTGVLNSQAVNFFKQFGVKVLHLPRHMGIKDLEMLSRNISGIELCVFGLNGMCVNIEAFCSLHYLKEGYFIPCNYFETVKITNNKNISKDTLDRKINSPSISCGICAFKKLKEMGISSIKIEGRGLSTNEKIKSINIVKKSAEMIKKGISDKEYYLFCKSLFKKYFNKNCKPEYCYF